MANQYDDLLNALFNPYASEIMQAYGYVPPSGTPSITEPYVPPSGTLGTVFSTGGTGGGGYGYGSQPYTPPSGTGPQPYTPPPSGTPGGTPGGNVGGTGGGGSYPSGGGTAAPYNQSEEFLNFMEADIQNRFGGDRFLHSKRGLVGGDDLGARQTYSLDEFTSGILPYAKGKYDSGVFVDPQTGMMYNHISEEELARRRDDGRGNARIFGVHPSVTTDREKQLLMLGGMGETSQGTRYIRIGGPTNGTHYFIEGDQVYAYDYTAGDTLGFGGQGPRYGEDNFQSTPVLSNESSTAQTAQAEQKEVGPSLASDFVMEVAAPSLPRQELTLASPSMRQPIPPPDQGTPVPPIMTPPFVPGPQGTSVPNPAVPPSNQGPPPPPFVPGPPPVIPPFNPPPGREIPRAYPQPPVSPPPYRVIPRAYPQPQVSPPQEIPFAPFVPEPPPRRLIPDIPTLSPATPAPPPRQVPSAASLSPEQQAALQQSLQNLSAGQLQFNQGGPVTSGIGELFKKEVMR